MMLNLKDPSTQPLHNRISTELARQIIDGEMPAGEELPTITEFVREHGVSRSTVRKAYDDLALRGLIRTGRRSRFHVAPLEDDTRRAIAVCGAMKQQPLLTAIESFSRDLASVFTEAKLCQMLAASIRRFVGTEDVRVLLFDAGEGCYVEKSVSGSDRSLAAGSGDRLVRDLTEAGGPIPLEKTQGDEPQGELFDELQELGVRTVLPLEDGGGLHGMVTLGKGAGGRGYQADGIELAMMLSRQFLTALITARAYARIIEKQRTGDELRIARQIQAKLLSKSRDLQGGFDLAVSSTPSRTVVGDFYDYFPIGESRLGLVIADTSGKGIPAAILISQIQATVKDDIGNGNTIRQTMGDLNERLRGSASDERPATLFYGIVDRRGGRLEFANAGHTSPLLVRQNGELTELRSTGPALGASCGREHETGSTAIREGDCILLYTDGVTTSAATSGRRYGVLRLKDLLVRNRHLSAAEIIRIIESDLRTFSPGEVPDDDRTLIVVRVNSVSP
jgi:serine phosphatase RsbU (regulator of sigma subunit)/DNA-binding transcriptional regulator YhcF (GntR family)